MTKPLKGVVVIVLNSEGKSLLLQRSDTAKHSQGKWENPGGHVEEGETLIEAAKRELEEEAGIKAVDLEKVFEKNFTNKETKKSYEMTIFKTTTDDEVKITEKDTFSGYGWFEKSELKDIDLADYAAYDYEQIGWL